MEKLDEQIIDDEFKKAADELELDEWRDFIRSYADFSWIEPVMKFLDYDIKKDAIVAMKKIIKKRQWREEQL